MPTLSGEVLLTDDFSPSAFYFSENFCRFGASRASSLLKNFPLRLLPRRPNVVFAHFVPRPTVSFVRPPFFSFRIFPFWGTFLFFPPLPCARPLSAAALWCPVGYQFPRRGWLPITCSALGALKKKSTKTHAPREGGVRRAYYLGLM